jgi:hypothetical protein
MLELVVAAVSAILYVVTLAPIFISNMVKSWKRGEIFCFETKPGAIAELQQMGGIHFN